MTDQIEAELKLKLEDLVDTFVVKGLKTSRVIELAQQQLIELSKAYEKDPDPADEKVADLSEPANDWPGSVQE